MKQVKEQTNTVKCGCRDYKLARGNGKSIMTLLAVAKQCDCLEEVLAQLKERESGEDE